jgi:sulfhydrogenase subunit gamma (sulfur reductase)
MSCKNENVYVPHMAVIDEIRDEISDVKTFYYHFEDREREAEFKAFMPGQFAMVSIFGAGEIALSLPPSPTEDRLFFTSRRVGSVSGAMHELKAGSRFALRGPFGNGFPMKRYEGRNLIIVAGGIGLIPLRSVIMYALHNRPSFGKIQVFYGSRTPRDLMYVDNLKQWQSDKGFECYLTVDRAEDGWDGNVGVVGSLFKRPGVEMPVNTTTVFVCGPPIMFRFVLADLEKMGFKDDNIVSTLERYMKCGVGKCGHCCIGVAYVCTDGPVFTLEQIRKLGEVI